jgi:predicted nucleic acid-binding Zn ribbon protein
MPAYDYHCETNGRTVEVSHAMTTLLQTWGELCDTGDLDPGATPGDAPLRRVFSAPLIGGKEPAMAAPPAPSVPCQPNGCPCCH